MSVSLVLLPLAVAAVTAAQARARERDGDGRLVCHVGTRMRDQGLLADALTDTGAAVNDDERGDITAVWQGVSATFVRDTDGIWSAHLSGQVDDDRATDIVRAIDAAYGRRVQSALAERLRQRAPAAGLRLESEERDHDDSIVMVLAVEQAIS